VLGNHDEAVFAGSPRALHGDALAVVEWTRRQLDAAQTGFLRSLPLRIEEEGRLWVHANGWSPSGWEYVRSPEDAARSLAATSARLTACGHLHSQTLYYQGPSGRVGTFAPVPGVEIPLGGLRRWLIVLAAVGQPRDGNPAAAYAVHDTARGSLTCHRVAYDAAGASRKIREAGLPAWLGARLEAGG
jgi:diadenosine tetraphosphatase ApaH/serine/threonine PP2A family protein phosphatase